MKTLRFALIAVFIATALVNQASADDFKGKPRKAVSITFDRAVKNPGLVMAIYQQVDTRFLNTIEQLYVVEVVYNGALYRILGSRQSWIRFFRPDPIPLTVKTREGGGKSQ
jgi:hypothetical protein